MSTIRTYRHHPTKAADIAGTLVDTEDEDLVSTSGAISVTTDTTGWNAPDDYEITITRQDTGEMESDKSNAIALHVNAAGGPALVNHNTVQDTPANSTSRTYRVPWTTTPGNVLVVVAVGDDAYTPGSITDNAGTTWGTEISQSPGATYELVRFGEIGSSNNSAHDITISGVVAWSNNWILVSEWSGLVDSAHLDVSNIFTDYAVYTSSAITTTNANDLVIAVVKNANATPDTFSQSADFTLLDRITSGYSLTTGVAYRILTSTASNLTETWTHTGGDGNIGHIIFALKA